MQRLRCILYVIEAAKNLDSKENTFYYWNNKLYLAFTYNNCRLFLLSTFFLFVCLFIRLVNKISYGIYCSIQHCTMYLFSIYLTEFCFYFLTLSFNANRSEMLTTGAKWEYCMDCCTDGMKHCFRLISIQFNSIVWYIM